MKQFLGETDTTDADRTASLCVETGIRLVRIARRAVREAPDATLTPPKIRTLAFLDESPAACLSDVAEHLIVGPPTASKLVDDLVERGLLRRSADSADRRKLVLRITPAGRRALSTAARPAQERFRQILERLTAEDLARVHVGLATLLPVLLSAGGQTGGEGEVEVADE